MIQSLRYGSDRQLEIEIAPERLVADCAKPLNSDAVNALNAASAVKAPLDFPPLNQAIVPGDQVVLALAAGVPQATDVVAAIVPALIEGGVQGEDVTVVQTPADVEAGQPDPRSKLPEKLQNAVQLFTHNPTEQTQLSYLAADAQGEPIYLNRRMCEADFVIPIGCLWPAEAVHSSDSKSLWNETIYPTFGDRKTIESLSLNGIPQSKGQLASRYRQIDQVAGLLGAYVTAQVVPAGNDRSLRVLIGSPQKVFSTGRDLCRDAWQYVVPRQASLVVAGIGGGATQQTWQNVGRALESSLRVVAEGGAIVICTELSEPPGPALKLLATAADLDTLPHRLRKLHSPDAHLARLLAESLDRVSIYLLSEHDEDTVVPLGLAHVASAAEINRLAARCDSCILINDAQYAVPIVVEA